MKPAPLLAALALAACAPAADAAPFAVEAGDEWIPIDNRRDILPGSALDFSGMGFQDAPAGKHGWLRNVGGHFEFEGLPGKPQRFCGVNLSLTANYPDHATADALVARLVRLGYNAVRIHHHDGAWAKAMAEHELQSGNGATCANLPPVFASAGAAAPPPIDRLDYLLARCFEHGIYATTDLFVSRPVKWRDVGVDQDGEIDMNVFKMLCAIHEPSYRNWADFADRFMSHVNPYTGRAYKDEPAMPLVSLVNEGGFFIGWNNGGRDDPRVADAWRGWMTARRAADPAFAPDLAPDETPRVFWWLDVHPAIAQWTGELEARMVARMKSHLRSLGCKALLSNDNCGPHYAALQRATADYDYIDDHFYIDHPRFPETPWNLPSTCTGENPLLGGEHLKPSETAFARMLDKPFTVTEWNFAAPSPLRGMGGLLAGSMAALQDWDGLWRFQYSYLDSELGDRGTRGPHYFDLSTDPVAQASERAVLCLFLRGDLPPFEDGVALWDTEESATAPDKTLWGYPPWCDAAWKMRVGSCLSPSAAGTLRLIRREDAEGPAPDAPPEGSAPVVSIDRQRGTIAISTPRTCGGFAPSGRLDAGPLSFEIVEPFDRLTVAPLPSSPADAQNSAKNLSTFQPFNLSTERGGHAVPATLWASSLDGAPIPASRRILVTHLTDAQGGGAEFADATLTKLLALGTGALLRNGSAKVELRLDAPRPCNAGFAPGAPSPGTASPEPGATSPGVFALDTTGRRTAAIPAAYDPATGILRFTASTRGPDGKGVLCYEIVR